MVVGDFYNDMVMFGVVYVGFLFYVLLNVIVEFLYFFVLDIYDELLVCIIVVLEFGFDAVVVV